MKTIVYRIYTENTPEYRKSARRLLSVYVDGWTELDGIGVWRGNVERSLVFEIVDVAQVFGRAACRDVCRLIAAENNQEAVLWTVGAVDAGLEPGECS